MSSFPIPDDATWKAEDVIAPPCPHYESCGGCRLQHLKEDVYRTWKEDAVRGVLAQNGIAPEEWAPSVFIAAGRRRRATFAARKKGGTVTLGFNGFRSHDLVDIGSCMLLTPRINAVIPSLRESLADIIPEGESVDVFLQNVGEQVDCVLTGDVIAGGKKDLSSKQIALLARMADLIGLARISLRKGERDIPETQIDLMPIRAQFGALTVDIPPSAFLQPSAEGEAALVAAVMNGIGKGSKKRKIADLFCGCGTFTGPLAAASQVHALDGDRAAIVSLRKAAKGFVNLQAEERDLFREPLGPRELRNYDVVVLDPPRAGAASQAAQLAKSTVPNAVYVSCNPETFARDAKIMLAAGYALKSIQMVDQFIWSSHAELVGVFYRR
jgi:23S rRNA (uracil1939-C5)-methyltransferase